MPPSRVRSLRGLWPLPRATPRGRGALGKYFNTQLPLRESLIRTSVSRPRAYTASRASTNLEEGAQRGRQPSTPCADLRTHCGRRSGKPLTCLGTVYF